MDKKRFPSISILKKAQKHPSGAVIINGTNEILVDLFLKKLLLIQLWYISLEF